MPAGLIFAHKGQGMFLDCASALSPLLGAHSTRLFQYFAEIFVGSGEATVSGSAARDYGPGVIGNLPFPESLIDSCGSVVTSRTSSLMAVMSQLANDGDEKLLFRAKWEPRRTIHETARAFKKRRLGLIREALLVSKALEELIREHLGVEPSALQEIFSSVGKHPVLDFDEGDEAELGEIIEQYLDQSINKIVDEAVGNGLASRAITKKSYFVDRFHELLAHHLSVSATTLVSANAAAGLLSGGEAQRFVNDLVSFVVGVAFGRFDLRDVTDEASRLSDRDPFDPLPVCSPGMLTDDDVFPCEHPPAGYPIDFPLDGILVDDPGPGGTAPAEHDFAQTNAYHHRHPVGR